MLKLAFTYCKEKKSKKTHWSPKANIEGKTPLEQRKYYYIILFNELVQGTAEIKVCTRFEEYQSIIATCRTEIKVFQKRSKCVRRTRIGAQFRVLSMGHSITDIWTALYV